MHRSHQLRQHIEEKFKEAWNTQKPANPQCPPPVSHNPAFCEADYPVGYQGKVFIPFTPEQQVEIAPLPNKAWVNDLNPVIREYKLSGSSAGRNPYQYHYNRVKLMRALAADLSVYNDPYTRPIDNIQDSLAFQVAKNGHPKFIDYRSTF